MKHYTINADNNITIHDSRKAARETGEGVFTNEEQLAELIGNDSKRLVEIWNSVAGVTPVKKFTNRKLATERIWKALQGLGRPAPAQPVTEQRVVAAEPETPFDEAQPVAPETPETATVDAQTPAVAPAKPKATRKTTAAKKALKAKDAAAPRKDSKTAQVVAMLQRKNGATLAEIMESMGWKRHTVRGFMAGAMKKAGFAVESFKPEGGERTYRISDGRR